jgi:EAL and modified HD-GYP domain-containing signal transduction protein
MEIHVARQPIFNRRKETFAYELFYRSKDERDSSEINQDSATATVMANSLLTIGMDRLAEGKKCFIKFTDTLIGYNLPTLLDSGNVVIELMRDAVKSLDLTEACKKLKEKGFMLALDDYYIYQSDFPEEALEYLDYVKVDFTKNSPLERDDIARKLLKKNVKLIAECVESNEDFLEGMDMGYDYFQGYFFNKPEVISHKDIPASKLNALHIISELNQMEPSFDVIEGIIKKDVSLSYKLLKLINSAAFHVNVQVMSVRQALVMLGFTEIRKFMYLILLYDICEDKPDELVRNTLVRAKFGDYISRKFTGKVDHGEIYLMELFSSIDAMLNRPMADILEELPLSERVKSALRGDKNIYQDIHQMISFYEKGQWQSYYEQLDKLKITDECIAEYFLLSLDWTREIFQVWNNYSI